MKHENKEVCERCEEFLKEGHDDIQYWFSVVKVAFPTVHTSCVYRGKDAQDALVKEKKSLLKHPHSMHNKKPSEAMDLFRLTEDGKAEFRNGFYVQIANFLEDAGAPIDWGGEWRNFPDAPHFQMKTRMVTKIKG